MKRLVLAPRIAGELDEIYRYTRDNFGVAQAERYLHEIRAAFSLIQENENIGRPRDEIMTGLRSLVVGGHVIFYRIAASAVEIVGAPNARRDVGRYFSPGKDR